MYILHLVHQYLPEYVGGTELYTRTLAAELTARGHDNTVFYRVSRPGTGHAARDDDGMRVVAAWHGEVTPTSRLRATFGDRAVVAALADEVAARRPDVVHVQHLMGLPATALARIQAAGIPTVITLHDYWWLCANAQLLTNDSAAVCAGPDRWFVNCGRCALARAGRGDRLGLAPAVAPVFAARARRLGPLLRAADALIAPTRFVADLYAQAGVPTARLHVVPHGIRVPLDGVQASGGDSAESLRVAYIGGLAWQKGVHVLIDAVNALPEPVTLDIYGDTAADPAYVADLRRRIRRPGITLHGRLPHADLWRALAAADVVAVPSLWYETASLIIQEAFAAGVPVVASDLGVMRERVRDGVDGHLVAPGAVDDWRACLRRLLDHPAERAALRRQIAPVRTIGRHVDDIAAVYRAVQRS